MSYAKGGAKLLVCHLWYGIDSGTGGPWFDVGPNTRNDDAWGVGEELSDSSE